MEKKYDYKNFNGLTDDKIFNINLSWMYNPQLYDEISQDVVARYNKDKDSNELLSIKTFLDNITSEYIKNKKDALEEFKTVKNNVKSENLKDIVKELVERTKMRRQNKETYKKYASRTFAPPDPDSDDSDKCTEMYYTPYSSIIDDEKTEKVYEKGYDREGFDDARYDKYGFNEDGFNEDGYDKWGLIKMGLIKMGMINGGVMKMGLIKMEKR